MTGEDSKTKKEMADMQQHSKPTDETEKEDTKKNRKLSSLYKGLIAAFFLSLGVGVFWLGGMGKKYPTNAEKVDSVYTEAPREWTEEQQDIINLMYGLWYDTGKEHFFYITEDEITITKRPDEYVRDGLENGVGKTTYRLEMVNADTRDVQLLVRDMDNLNIITLDFDFLVDDRARGFSGFRVDESSSVISDEIFNFTQWLKVADLNNASMGAVTAFKQLSRPKTDLHLPIDSKYYDWTEAQQELDSAYKFRFNQLTDMGLVIPNSPEKTSLLITNPAITSSVKLLAQGTGTELQQEIWDLALSQIEEAYQGIAQPYTLDVYIADSYPHFTQVLSIQGSIENVLEDNPFIYTTLSYSLDDLKARILGYWIEPIGRLYRFNETHVSIGNLSVNDFENGKDTVLKETIEYMDYSSHDVSYELYSEISVVIVSIGKKDPSRLYFDFANGSDTVMVGEYTPKSETYPGGFLNWTYSRIGDVTTSVEEAIDIYWDVIADERNLKD